MPAVAAHYQFGQLALAKTKQATQKQAEAHKAMFDLGTQGPDLLFYFRPHQKNSISRIGSALHQHSGTDFFQPMWADRANWTPEQTAYLLGVCCHFALDRRCHPFVDRKAPTTAEHQRLESAFDRLVIEQYHLTSKRQAMLPTKGVSLQALQACYPDVSIAQLREAVLTIHHANHLLGNSKLVQGLERVIGKQGSFSSLCMPAGTISVQAKLMMPLLQGAIEEAATLMNLLLADSTTLEMLQQAMPENFEGICINV